MDSPCAEYRAAALKLADRIDGSEATQQWIVKMNQMEPPAQTEILAMLGRRGDSQALPVVLEALRDRDVDVRLTAMDAAVRLGAEDALPSLLLAMRSAEEKSEIQALQSALLRLPGKETAAGAADALLTVSPACRVALLEVLGERRAADHLECVFSRTGDEDPSVRVAAIIALSHVAGETDLPRLIDLIFNASSAIERREAQATTVSIANEIEESARMDAIAQAIEENTGERRVYLLQILPKIAGEKALTIASENTQSEEENVRIAAVQALADWPDLSALEKLLNVYTQSDVSAQRDAARNGYTRIVEASSLAPEEKVLKLENALSIMKNDADKKTLLAALAKIRHVDALKVVETYLDNKPLCEDAAAAIVKIVCPPEAGKNGLHGIAIYNALKKAIDVTEDALLRSEAQDYLDSIPHPDDEGFIPLFNGKDLTGWIGDTNGYIVENDTLVCKPGGNLYTDNEYSDFIFHFEFKLTPGANNGLGIRTPSHGDAAYVGMELQIIDNTAAVYKNIKPYQKHGSIYGVVPAKTGFLKPVGEWNFEEVIAKGRRIKVILNGETIVDADIDEASAQGTIDGHNHPGLKRDKGHIGFLGHGSRVEFRNISVKELE